MSMMNMERKALLNKINMVSFALDDTRLFLDTHPKCGEALEYFEKMQEIRKVALKEYTHKYGPINAYQVDVDDKWTWNAGPLPWEVGGC